MYAYVHKHAQASLCACDRRVRCTPAENLSKPSPLNSVAVTRGKQNRPSVVVAPINIRIRQTAIIARDSIGYVHSSLQSLSEISHPRTVKDDIFLDRKKNERPIDPRTIQHNIPAHVFLVRLEELNWFSFQQSRVYDRGKTFKKGVRRLAISLQKFCVVTRIYTLIIVKAGRALTRYT